MLEIGAGTLQSADHSRSDVRWGLVIVGVTCIWLGWFRKVTVARLPASRSLTAVTVVVGALWRAAAVCLIGNACFSILLLVSTLQCAYLLGPFSSFLASIVASGA